MYLKLSNDIDKQWSCTCQKLRPIGQQKILRPTDSQKKLRPIDWQKNNKAKIPNGQLKRNLN